ncbi:TraB/GumN family protein [Flavobacterium sp. j3]|uniref:TraB/GumN family protein n=1 Tax=Flavobacterium aureirubrum TaxID=3133147 RepID=A0ABU9N2Y2_9FLAO
MTKVALLIAAVIVNLTNAQNNNNSLLWKISGNGLSKPSYLFGTIHITCDAALSDKVKKALDNTEQLCLELDMDDANMQAQMMQGMMMKDGVTMKSLAPADDFKIVDDFLKAQLGYSAEMLTTLKPFMVSAMLYPKMLPCEAQSVETELMKIGKAQNEEVIGLETIAEQMNVFDAISYQDQMDELVKTAKSNLKRDIAEINDMLALYKTEDIEAIYDFTQKSENVMTSKYTDVMLNDRNKNWISRIDKIAKEKPTFFGVGAAHLGGEQGVVKLLRKAGYTIEPVK